MEDTGSSRPKRVKRDSSYKAKAFERFKQLRSGTCSKYEVEAVENVYETVDEREYTKRVLQRQDDDWIVDDDGSGYVEDGRDIFDDDLDAESIAVATQSKNSKGVKRKKRQISEKAGRGNLQSFLSTVPNKKEENKTVAGDDMLSEILDEIENESSEVPIKHHTETITIRKQNTKKYMDSFETILSSTKSQENKENHVQTTQEEIIVKEEIVVTPQAPKNLNRIPKEQHKEEIADTKQEVVTSNDTKRLDIFAETVAPPAKETKLKKIDVNKSTVNNSADLLDDTIDENLFNDDDFEKSYSTIDFDALESSVSNPNENSFLFYWWDAYEDVNKQPGVVILFGKTFNVPTKSFVSCAVVVRNISRKIYFLPRKFNTETGKEVTMQCVHTEINELLLETMQIPEYKAKAVTKKYAFDPQIPLESDYIEVKYAAKYTRLSQQQSGATYSRVLGTETNFLELLLLECKIKGPCWLNISKPAYVTNRVTWCNIEIDCINTNNITTPKANEEKLPSTPPLVVAVLNLRSVINPKTESNEIVMISCVVQNHYEIDKPAPTRPNTKHFCVFTGPSTQVLPPNLHESLRKQCKLTTQKMDTEKALLNYFIGQFAKIDADLIVGHDMHGYQMTILSERLTAFGVQSFSKLSKLKLSKIVKNRLEKQLFLGRLVCDIKISAQELIRSRSYDLDTLCQCVLRMPEGGRLDMEAEDVNNMFHNSNDLIKLITLTIDDAMYILKIMYTLNVIPLAHQITNIAGNVMSATLLGGRSQRNEFLLLHAFNEKGYINPDKNHEVNTTTQSGSKKPMYSGGLVLNPKVAFYDKFVLLMDFNSLYPSIMQEYNICFTTVPIVKHEESVVLPDKNLPSGILPTEIRKLVESRRSVKKLLTNPDLTNELKLQYHIRQMALKLTANSMYGCLGFTNSRFYARHLAALITHLGREILTNTRDLVEKLRYEVVYGDTDSIMINTHITDYDQVLKIGTKIKQEVNKLYKQVELDIDGIFKYLLLLKKKKYAAVVLTRSKSGVLQEDVEYKGLDIVRRDWSQLSAEAGKFILKCIFSERTEEERLNVIEDHLKKIRDDLQTDKVPLNLLVITKQLSKAPNLYGGKNQQTHVQVAIRYNKAGGHLRAGDTVPYIICLDGTKNSATQRGYHVEELKNSNNQLKVDVEYYLSQQIHPVVARICEPIPEIDHYRIAEFLGLDMTKFKRSRPQIEKSNSNDLGQNVLLPETKFRNCDSFTFKCPDCNAVNSIDAPLRNNVPFLEKCSNDTCKAHPVNYLPSICNQLVMSANSYISKYYSQLMICEDPVCPNEQNRVISKFSGKYPVCSLCRNGVMLKAYTESQLYKQLGYFQHIFDLSKLENRPLMEKRIEDGFDVLKQTVEKKLQRSGYSVIDMAETFSLFKVRTKHSNLITTDISLEDLQLDENAMNLEGIDV